MKVNQIGTKFKRKGSQKELAQALEVTPRTIRNWGKKKSPEAFPKLGRPAHDELSHRRAFWGVGREYLRQGRCGALAIATALEGRVPTRLIQNYTRRFKACQKRHERRRILPRRQCVEVLAKDALWVQDGAQIGRRQDGPAIESQIVKDRGSLVTVAISTGEPACGADVINLLDQLKSTRGLPLVLGTDNGSSYVCEATQGYLQAEKVIHLLSLPRTPQHNGSAEVGIGEIKRCAGVRADLITTPQAGHTKVTRAAQLLNKNRVRQSKGFKTAAQLDEKLVAGYHQVERDRFYEDCSKRIEQAKLGLTNWREQRMAERDAIFETMAKYGLIRKHRGGSHAAAKAEIFS